MISSRTRRWWRIVNCSECSIWCQRELFITFILLLLIQLMLISSWLMMIEYTITKEIIYSKFIQNMRECSMGMCSARSSGASTQVPLSLMLWLWLRSCSGQKSQPTWSLTPFGSTSSKSSQKLESSANSSHTSNISQGLLLKDASPKTFTLLNTDTSVECSSTTTKSKSLSWMN